MNWLLRRIERVERQGNAKQLKYVARVPETREPPLTVSPEGELVAGRVKVARKQHSNCAKIYRASIGQTGLVQVRRIK